MNYFKAAEQVLSSVPTLEQALGNLERRKQRLIDSGAPSEGSNIDYSKPFTDSHYVNDTLNELLELAECSRNIAETKERLGEVKDILKQLSEEHAKIISLWYIKKLSKERVMEEMYVESLTTVYNLRNRAVAEFALLYYGASALRSI